MDVVNVRWTLRQRCVHFLFVMILKICKAYHELATCYLLLSDFSQISVELFSIGHNLTEFTDILKICKAYHELATCYLLPPEFLEISVDLIKS